MKIKMDESSSIDEIGSRAATVNLRFAGQLPYDLSYFVDWR